MRKGDLIAEIDDMRYAATLATAAQQAENQRQVLARLVNGSRPEEIAQAKATMESLAANYQNDKINFGARRRSEAGQRHFAIDTRQRQGAERFFARKLRSGEAGLYSRRQRSAPGRYRRGPRRRQIR